MNKLDILPTTAEMITKLGLSFPQMLRGPPWPVGRSVV